MTIDSSQAKDSPQDSLQHYFDDLLLEGSVEAETFAPQPQLKPQVETTNTVDVSEVDYQQQQRQKESLAKQKLAKLLSSAPKAQVSTSVETQVETKVEAQVEAKVEAKIETAIETEVVDAPAVAEAQIATETVEIAEVAVDEELAVAEEVAVDEEQATDTAAAEDQLLDSLAWLDNGRPRWAQERFDVLLFSVSGLTLAVPLIALGQIQPLTDELTPLFGQADWFMGLQPTPMGKIRTVNTAKFVMPERYDESFLETAKYVISIDGLPWGLAVDAVNQPITLEPEDVKWRGERSKRAWLAGTVKQHMCALIDIPMMGQLLENEDHAKKI